MPTRWKACRCAGVTCVCVNYKLKELLVRLSWLGLAVLLAVSGGHATAATRPNFLIIVADDMGFADIGCYGGEIATPNLDKLASNGLKFTQCYSTARCWPSRSCLLTGYYAQQVGMDPPTRKKLPPWARLLPHYLKPEGYRCYHSGKWHIMNAPRPVQDGGFDRSYSIEDHDRYFAPKRAMLDDKWLPPVAPDSGFYLTTAIADYAIGFLREHAQTNADKPFCLYLAFTSPHFPLHALPQDIERYKDVYLKGWDEVRKERFARQKKMGLVSGSLSPLDPKTIPSWNLSEEELYQKIGPGEVGHAVPWKTLTPEQKKFQATKMAIHAAMIDRMDREIGRVLEQIRSMNAWDNTVVFFVSDNGASAEQIIRGDKHDTNAPPGSAATFLCLGPGWSTAANTPFRLHKSWVHEGGISSPLIVHWPAGISTGGALRRGPVHFVDILPTVLELAGVKPSESWNGHRPPPLPGRSFLPLLARDDPGWQRDWLYFSHVGNRALRVGDWKAVAAGTNGAWELYNLQRDREELRDLSKRYPDKLREMVKQWETLDKEFRQQAVSEDWPPVTAR